jgi:hypothetical protein
MNKPRYFATLHVQQADLAAILSALDVSIDKGRGLRGLCHEREFQSGTDVEKKKHFWIVASRLGCTIEHWAPRLGFARARTGRGR